MFSGRHIQVLKEYNYQQAGYYPEHWMVKTYNCFFSYFLIKDVRKNRNIE